MFNSNICRVFKGLCHVVVREALGGGPREVPCLSFPMQSSCITGGGGGPWLIILLLFQLSAVEAGGSTAFIYANFSVPVVKVRETPMSPPGVGTGDTALLCLVSRRELWLSLFRCQTPTPGLPDLFWSAKPPPWDSWLPSRGAKPQSRSSQLWFGVQNPNPGAPICVLGCQKSSLRDPGSISGCQNPNPRSPSFVLGVSHASPWAPGSV